MRETEVVLRRLARETGRYLGELGVRPRDEAWLSKHAATIASLTVPEARGRMPGPVARLLRRLSRAGGP